MIPDLKFRPSSSPLLLNLIKYSLLPSIPLSIIASLSADPNLLKLSDLDHFYFESFAVILSTIVAIYCIARAYALNDKFSLFFGIGFLTSAMIDMMHAVVSINGIDQPLFLKYFIPQTWFAGRIFISGMMFIAIIKYAGSLTESESRKKIYESDQISSKKISHGTTYSKLKSDNQADVKSEEKKSQHKQENEPEIIENKTHSRAFSENNRNKTPNRERDKLEISLLAYLVALAVLATSVAAVSLYTVFPNIVISYPLHRPYEIPSLILFVLALVFFYKKHLFMVPDIFYKGIMASLIIDIFSQIIMSYSTTSFDTAHNISHILKDVSYFVNIIALALSSIQYNKRLSYNNRILEQREQIIKQQYLKLKEADKAQKEFINIAAHELRTPIQPILGLAEVLRSRKDDSNISSSTDRQLQINFLDAIIRNAKRLQKLTEEILDVTKIESKSLYLKIERLDITKILYEITNELKNNPVATKNGIEILFNANPSEIFVNADRNRIRQVVSNLIDNSIKFTTSGTILVSVKAIKGESGMLRDDEVLIAISDTGHGLDETNFSKLFSKFSSSSSSGTGLGLFICKSIIELHNGRIWAENNSNGIGSTFYFRLPVYKKEKKLSNECLDPILKRPNELKEYARVNTIMTKAQILVVDDEPDVNLTLKIVLEDNGYSVDLYSGPYQALENYVPGKYDLLILDIRMPGMNGFELYQKIRKIDTKVKVCFLTALSELKGDELIPGDIDPNWNKGNYIQKPIENENLLNKINDLLKS